MSGCFSSESDIEIPASMSWRTSARISFSFSFSVCSSSTWNARRIDTPAATIVASWRVMTVSSCGLMRRNRSNRSWFVRLVFSSTMSRTISPRLAQLIGDGLLGVRLELALRGNAREVDRLECERRPSGLRAYAAFTPRPISLRSSSGVLERDSASSRVILPARTSWASDASIGSMPCAPPVCSTEWIWCVLPSRIRFRTAGVQHQHLAWPPRGSSRRRSAAAAGS